MTPAPRSRRRLLPLQLAALCAVCATVAVPARANGDPASHYLILDPAFFPFEHRASPAAKQKLRQVLAEAKAEGLDVRVALIATPADLGRIPQLFERPQPYAELLAKELRAYYRGHVLAAMPNGLGIHRVGEPSAEDVELVAGLPAPGDAGDDLAAGAADAVRALADARGLELPSSPAGSDGSSSADRILIAVAAAFVLAAVVAIRALQRRARREQPDAS
jgi:hypothetical protein